MKIIFCLGSDVNDTTNPVIEGYPMIFLSCFNSSSIRGFAMKSSFAKYISTEKCGLWNFTYYFVFFSNILVWCLWWYDLYSQYWCLVRFGRCWYQVDLFIFLLERYSQIEYHFLSVFQIKYYSVLPWGYRMLQLKERIYMFCKSMIRHHGQMKFW